jgi:hypothetical protein
MTIRFGDWHCPDGHLIYKHTQRDIRLIF